MNEINFNNLPEAVGILIQKVEGLESLILSKQASEVREFDRITDVNEVCKIVGYGKSKIYKLTSEKKIPFKLMGNRLVFSRKELIEWVETNTVNSVSSQSCVLNAIAASASKKRKG
ncbi:MAG: helix-turn-helix domain-containing protein [Bacteroidota bacterium]